MAVKNWEMLKMAMGTDEWQLQQRDNVAVKMLCTLAC